VIVHLNSLPRAHARLQTLQRFPPSTLPTNRFSPELACFQEFIRLFQCVSPKSRARSRRQCQALWHRVVPCSMRGLPMWSPSRSCFISTAFFGTNERFGFGALTAANKLPPTRLGYAGHARRRMSMWTIFLSSIVASPAASSQKHINAIIASARS
jgi:hypothetical protein